MTEAKESESSYVFEADASEIARLLARNEFLTKAMGGLFPERTGLVGVSRILDIGCGPGGWAVDVARSYPDIEVVGIDISEKMIASARNKARKLRSGNVTFLKMDALQPLQFPDQYFDLVNMRAAVEYVPQTNWHALLQECYRVTQPGGVLRLMESDRIALTNSLAFERYHSFYTQMLYRGGYGFSPDGHTFGMTPMLGKMLHNAGYQRTSLKSYAFDLSYNTPFQRDYRYLLDMRFQKMRHLLLEREWVTLEELENLSHLLLSDIVRETFCGIAYGVIFWGEK